MKKLILLLLSLSLLFCLGCKSEEETDNCEEDRTDGKWQAVADSDQCSNGEKGEAYLGLAGFDYFNLIRFQDSQSITEILGLTSSNWSSKLSYYKQASNTVRNSYQAGDDREKTVFFFGSFLSMYTDFSGNLDNGDDGSATALDGTITPGEIEKFSGVTQNASGGDSDIILTPTSKYQIKSGGVYYIFNSDTNTLYEDDQSDGIENANTGFSIFQIAAVTAAATEVNQVVQIDKIADPLASVSDPSTVTDFATRLLNYLGDIQNSLNSLNVENDSELVKPIIEFREDLDNGAQCTTLKSFPALSIANLFVANTQKTELSDYSSTNKVDVNDIINLYSTFTATPPTGISVPLGVKLIFKTNTATYTAHWDTSHTTDVKDAMESLELLGTTDVEALDGKISYTELVCASELIADN